VVCPHDLARSSIIIIVVLVDGFVGQAEGGNGRPKRATSVLREEARAA
jgi:hypothetical protein